MNRYPFVLITLIFFAILSLYELYQGYSHFTNTMLNKSRDIAGISKAFGKWSSEIGTVYVPSELVKPEETAQDAGKGLDGSGKSLSRVNPVYMMNLAAKGMNSDIHVRLISRKPVNGNNIPEGWEVKGLHRVYDGQREYHRLDFKSKDAIYFQYMSPFVVDETCKRCHQYANYKTGDIRGAISITFPVTAEHNKHFIFTILTILAYMLAAALVIRLITLSRREVYASWREKLKTIKELETEMNRRVMSEAALIHKTRSSSINEILRMVAHHWRQPLNNIGLLIQTIPLAGTKQEEEEAAQQALKVVKDMSDTIDLFTSAAKVENKVRLEIKTMTFDALKLLRPEFESVGIEVYVNCHMGGVFEEIQMTGEDNVFFSCGRGTFTCDNLCGFSHIYVNGEESMFKQILLIVLKNAYDSLVEKPEGEERLITIRFIRKGEYAQIEICDNGAPITPEVKERLFEPYFSTKGCGAGTGIGLFTAQNLAANFDGGDLFYDDSDGKCFIFRIKPSEHD